MLDGYSRVTPVDARTRRPADRRRCRGTRPTVRAPTLWGA